MVSLLMLGSLKVGAFVNLVKGLKSIIMRGLQGSDLVTGKSAMVFLCLILVSLRMPAVQLYLFLPLNLVHQRDNSFFPCKQRYGSYS